MTRHFYVESFFVQISLLVLLSSRYLESKNSFVLVKNTLPFELLRDAFLISEDAVRFYSSAALDFLAGKTIEVGLFGELELPDTPDNIAMVPMAGILTKADICGSMGSRSLTKMVQAAASNPEIDAIIIYAESCPGGQVDGTQVLAQSIVEARKYKPVIGVVSGMACSGGIWVLSQCNEIFATSPTDQIGCIGVMAKMANPKNVKAGEDGYITVYSDLSPDKNKEFADPQILKTNYLNPIAKIFHQEVKSGRGERLNLDKEDVLSGKTYVANEAKKGGLIDGILSFDKILSRTIYLSKKMQNP